MVNVSAQAALQAENVRLIALLEQHGIEWRLSCAQMRPAPSEMAKESLDSNTSNESVFPASPQESSHSKHATTDVGVAEQKPDSSQLSAAEKIALFRRLFRGRVDVFPIRWESKTSGKSGYAPACANEWQPGVCQKPRIKCSDCANRALIPTSDAVVFDHLRGKHTIGVYPILTDDSCYFLAVDFDEAEWKEDAQAFRQSCMELGIPAALEISRSGNGAHIWIFFAQSVSARDARRLGTAIISHTCARTRQLKLSSYDRLFPNQDTLPKGGFGNLIALPLQKQPRENGWSVFVDLALCPYVDQWSYLSTLSLMAANDIEPAVLRATGSIHPLDVTFIDEQDQREPWKRPIATALRLLDVMPDSVSVTLANLIYFEKAQLPQALANRLIRLAAFQNPEFYKAQAMRMSTWDKPRVVGCAENFPKHIALPRGCLDAVLVLLRDNAIQVSLADERLVGEPFATVFAGTLRADQELAVRAMMRHETGVFCAPTAFGKTVTAAAIIARRGVNTLVLVHRTELLKQWQARLQSFLDIGKGAIGTIGGGKSKPTGKIDIAVMQSLSRRGEINALVENYGHVIIDECHHVGAVSFDAILKKVKAKFVLGLTATPIRRDGLQAIIFMQCGQIRHTAARAASAPNDLTVMPRFLAKNISTAADVGIQAVFRRLVTDADRTLAICDEIQSAFAQARKVLVLTERTEHLEAIFAALVEKLPTPFVLHGRMTKKQRASVVQELELLPPDAPRILIATGKLVGEGFDHPPLDTLVLAMPVSWKGTLQQYAGRLHREHATKTDVRIIDFVDIGHPALLRMWHKRQRGYRVMGYRIADQGGTE